MARVQGKGANAPMTPVYEANDAMDAQLVFDLLRDAGIAAHVTGAALAGAVGELPAQGLVRVWAGDGDAERARALIADWHAAEVPGEEELERIADRMPPDDGMFFA
jgi:hypothetical protein